MILLIFSLAHAGVPELTLADTLRLVVERNPQASSAALGELVAEIDARRARLDRASATLSASGDGAVGFEKAWGEDLFGAASVDWETRATVTVPLYAGGSVQATIDAADAGARIASTDRVLTERELVRAAYNAYWTIKGYELQIAATEEGLALTQASLDIIVAKADAGLAAGIDVNRSKVDLYTQEDTRVAQRASLYEAQQDLLELLHLDGDAVVLTDAPPEPTAGPLVVPSDAGVGRPELRRKADEAAQAEAAVRLARSAMLPSVSVYGTAGVGGTAAGLTDPDSVAAFSEDGLRPAIDGSVGLQVSWNVFDLFRTRDAVAQARLLAQQVDASTIAEKDKINGEIHRAASRVSALRERVPLSDAQVALARDNVQIVQGLYAQGSATLLDLFNAQSSFRAARTQGASLRVQLAIAESDLQWLYGADLLGASR